MYWSVTHFPSLHLLPSSKLPPPLPLKMASTCLMPAPCFLIPSYTHITNYCGGIPSTPWFSSCCALCQLCGPAYQMYMASEGLHERGPGRGRGGVGDIEDVPGLAEESLMSRGVGRTCISPSWSTSTLLPGREYSTPSLPTLGTGSCRGACRRHSQHLRNTGIRTEGQICCLKSYAPNPKPSTTNASPTPHTRASGRCLTASQTCKRHVRHM